MCALSLGHNHDWGSSSWNIIRISILIWCTIHYEKTEMFFLYHSFILYITHSYSMWKYPVLSLLALHNPSYLIYLLKFNLVRNVWVDFIFPVAYISLFCLEPHNLQRFYLGQYFILIFPLILNFLIFQDNNQLEWNIVCLTYWIFFRYNLYYSTLLGFSIILFLYMGTFWVSDIT